VDLDAADRSRDEAVEEVAVQPRRAQLPAEARGQEADLAGELELRVRGDPPAMRGGRVAAGGRRGEEQRGDERGAQNGTCSIESAPSGPTVTR
jgi:hypothetical protein